MTPAERRTAASLAAIFAFRMLGLFMILPVFALYAEHLEGTTHALVGVAIGVYGLTQALLQIPLGMASDAIGRKPVITAGLLLFALGSVVAALATTIHWVIIGRALQGAGAVASAVLALAADLTREDHRTKVMAVIGMTIGMSFLAAMVIGPLVAGWVGVPGIFWFTALLALVGVAIVNFVVPTPRHSRLHRDAEPVPSQFRSVLGDGQLLRLDAGILVLHLVLTAGFVAIPLQLRDLGMASFSHWQIYLPVMVLAMAGAIPFIVVAEKRRRMKQVLLGAIAALAVAELLLAGAHSVFAIAALLWLFFTAFNLLEATLPSLVAKTAPADRKGTAMGVYSTSQFLGAFIGGAGGGAAYGAFGAQAVFVLCAALLLGWFWYASTMREPRYLATTLLAVGAVDERRAAELTAQLALVRGVVEAVVSREDGVAYLKVDHALLDRDALEQFAVAGE